MLLITVQLSLISTSLCLSQDNGLNEEEIKLLLFTKTAEFRHENIPLGIEIIKYIGESNGYHVEHSEDSKIFNEEELSQFSAVILFNTSRDIFNSQEEKAFKNYVRSGGGVVGIHGATYTEFDWDWYGKLMGAYFDGHPAVQEATITVVDKNHPSTEMLPTRWKVVDEWYNFKDLQPYLNVIATLDETTYQGGSHGDYHPIAWYHEFEGGRVFYTGRGHTKASLLEPLFIEHILGGIKYVLDEE